MSERLYIDESLCTECGICLLACSFAKKRSFNPKQARLRLEEKSKGLTIVPVVCIQCGNPACLRVCPVKAISRAEDGRVLVDEEKCTGCKLCEKYCPLGAIKVDKNTRKAEKCDLCGDGEAQCAKWCPTDAIKVVNI